MIDCGPEPDNQMKFDLPGLNDDGAELMEEARRWRSANHIPVWIYYKELARQLSKSGPVSPNYILQQVRHEFRISIPNSYAAPLARIAMEEDATIDFRLARSKVDGFCEVKL